MAEGRQFGEVADVYEDARPGYAPEMADTIAAYHGRDPQDVLEIGAGTGKGTAILAALGGRLTCVEPDPRMAALLRSSYPAAHVIVAPFEDAAAGPADVVGCALAWHWLDPARRNRLAFDALRPGGTLAVFGHRYDYADPAHQKAFDRAFSSVDETPFLVRPDDWVHHDVLDSGLWTDVRDIQSSRTVPMKAAEYLRLVRTFGPFRAKPPALQEHLLELLTATLADLGGGTVLNLRGFLVLARRA
ncbi:class I SAM-dependent methyltransferase [Dactylosporangium sp. CS-033363]|uniref:class I SAM-dependent methyltransferase n=1 Tax=Dactylosporangium sp. CS-033363 TaxID=3239935 RepID=UPI003D8F86FA